MYMCKKTKASKTRGIGKILEVVAQTGRRDAGNSIILLLEGSAGWCRAVSSKPGARERAAQNFACPLKCSLCPCTKEIWVKRTCQSWNNLTEILLQKDMLWVGCLGVTAALALALEGKKAKAKQAEEVSSPSCGWQKRCLCCRTDVR